MGSEFIYPYWRGKLINKERLQQEERFQHKMRAEEAAGWRESVAGCHEVVGERGSAMW